MSGSTPADVLELTTDPADALALIGDSTRLVRDDFAGPGGWSTGIADLLKAEDLTEVALEWDQAACLTRVANGHVNTLRADVAAYPIEPFLGRTVLYIGSPPCQTFSMAGDGTGRAHVALLCECVRGILLGHFTYEEAMARLRTAGALDRPLDKREQATYDALPEDEREAYLATLDLVDPRNGLILIPARVIRQLLDHDGKGPTDLEAVALEQVPPAGDVFRAYANALGELGWSAVAIKINAADYGVPQTRERIFVLASRVRRITVPEPTHAKGGEEATLLGPGRLPWPSMARALGWIGGLYVAGSNGREAVRDVATEPASTVRANKDNGRILASIELVHSGHANATRRPADQPAGTIAVGKAYNDLRLEAATEEAGRFLLNRRAGKAGPDGDYPYAAPVLDVGVVPAPTITGKTGEVWALTDTVAERLNAGEVADAAWCEDRPATTVVGSFCPDVIAAPGYRVKVSRQNAPGSLRITETEGGILQGFPADYRWEGKTKGKRWEQIGNVVCPPVARRVIAELLGVDAAPLPWHAYAFEAGDTP